MKAFRLIILLSLLLLLASCSNNQKLSVASHVWPGYEFMFLARNLGLIDSNLISLHETQSASETLQLLKEGKVDGGALTFDEVIRARNDGIDLVVVLVFNISAGADVILAKTSISELSDLKGKRVGVEVGSVGSIMLDQLLKKANLTTQDIEVIEATNDEYLDIWQKDQVDAVITYEPISGKILKLGGHQIFSSQEAPNLIVDVLAIKADALKNRESIEHLINAHFQAKQHFSTHHQDALYRLAPRLGVTADEVDDVFKGLLLPDYQNNLRLLSGDNPELLHSAKLLSNILKMQPREKIDSHLQRIVDDTFLLSLKP